MTEASRIIPIAVPLPSIAIQQSTAMDSNGMKEKTSKVSMKTHLRGRPYGWGGGGGAARTGGGVISRNKKKQKSEKLIRSSH